MSDPLSYGSSLWSSTSLRAVEGQADEARAFLKRLITFTKDKNELDHYYAKQLRKLVDKLGVPEQSNEQRTFDLFMNAFKNLNLNIATAFDQAATKAEEQVVKPLNQYHEQHKKTTKQLEDEIKQAQKNLAAQQEALESAKQACKKACEELQRAKDNPQSVETAAEPIEQSSSFSDPLQSNQPTEKKNRFGGLFKREGGTKLFSAMSDKMHGAMASVNVQSIQNIGQKSDINSLTERALAADAKYVATVKSIREYRPQYDQHLTHLLNSSQTAEEEMRTSSTDLLATYLTLQTALFSSNVENMHTVGAVLGKVSAANDSQVFIRQNRSLGSVPALPVYEMQKGHPQYVEGAEHAEEDNVRSAEVDGKIVRKTTKKDQEEERSYQRIMNEQVLTLLVDKVTGYATDKASTSSDHSSKHVVEAQPLDAEETRVAARLFQTPEGRSAFATVVNLQRNRGQLHLSPTAFSSFASLVMLFLDHARDAMHVTPIQLVMILSQSLWRDPTPEEKADTNRDKIFLSTVVKSHPVWVDERFWNESFYDAFKSKLPEDQIRVHKWHSDSEQRESLHARKQAAFATLSTFVMNMAEFGMTKAQINNFVEKQAHLNDLDQEQIEMLRMMDQLHSRRASIDAGDTIGAFQHANEKLQLEQEQNSTTSTDAVATQSATTSDDTATNTSEPEVDPFADEANDAAQAAISSLQSVDDLWASAREL